MHDEGFSMTGTDVALDVTAPMPCSASPSLARHMPLPPPSCTYEKTVHSVRRGPTGASERLQCVNPVWTAAGASFLKSPGL